MDALTTDALLIVTFANLSISAGCFLGMIALTKHQNHERVLTEIGILGIISLATLFISLSAGCKWMGKHVL